MKDQIVYIIWSNGNKFPICAYTDKEIAELCLRDSNEMAKKNGLGGNYYEIKEAIIQ